MPQRFRAISPAEAGGERVCLLTAAAARAREAPIDRLLELGEMKAHGAGYDIRLPPGDQSWVLAIAFAEEEASCCPALALEVAESETAVVVSATF